MEKQPVVWVGLEDADRYCQSLGRRLPNEWEWAFAAQGEHSQRWVSDSVNAFSGA